MVAAEEMDFNDNDECVSVKGKKVSFGLVISD